MKIKNNLSQLRAQQGLSAQQLAALAGVQRQSIYAMEAGTYVPNTLIALRLAQTLQVKVEELFSLEEEKPVPVAEQEVEVLDLGERLVPGQPLQLCRIGKRTVGVPAAPLPVYLPPADAVLTHRARAGRKGKARVQCLRAEPESSPALLVAGCDPGISVLRRHLGKAGMELVMASCSSSKALELLKENQIHVAGSHLRDEKTGESNLPAVRRLFPRKSVAVANFAVWEQGIVVARGNPKVIKDTEDSTRKDLRHSSTVRQVRAAGICWMRCCASSAARAPRSTAMTRLPVGTFPRPGTSNQDMPTTALRLALRPRCSGSCFFR